MPSLSPPAALVACIIGDAYARYTSAFGDITRRARVRFEERDWHGAQADWVARLELYGKAVGETLATLQDPAADAGNRDVWKQARRAYFDRIAYGHGVELAETFFNSISRRTFTTVGVDPDVEFIDIRPSACPAGHAAPVTRTFVRRGSIEELVRQVLEHYWFAPGYQDVARDAACVAAIIERQAPGIDSIEMAASVFFRNKGAYLVGRIRRGHASVPLLLALLNPSGKVVVDAVMASEDEASIAFSFTRSYFFVDAPCPGELVRFLHAIMPRKPVGELYTSIGYNRHGKTELYRSLLQHLHTSRDRFEFAPGARGMVMIVFAMPSYDVIFKVVRDHFAQPKTCTRSDVMAKYQLVFKHDRAGRLIDAQEFEFLRFERDRFEPALLDELLAEASHSVRIEDDTVVLRHLYTERRVTPLDVYLASAAPEAAREAILDYGQALRELAATNIFPGDLLLKNFGVTRHGRVVFYDYDELALVTDCNFRTMPQPRGDDEEMAGEPWFYVGERDIFPEEFLPFLGLRDDVRDEFLAAHGDLLTARFWQERQEEQRCGAVVDIFPYSPRTRLTSA
ncbi:MAG: bifunctional isocitrate dehydrogenase kinase/phosphatase [Bacteroidales bacterium]